VSQCVGEYNCPSIRGWCFGLENRAGILSIRQQRKAANDYTIRLDNQVYQLLPPVYPGLRVGWVTIEKRMDGSMKIRFKGHYLEYLPIPSVQTRALPPDPWSLSLCRTPAVQPDKQKGCSATAEQPNAVRPAADRSGRTPAESCPVRSNDNYITDGAWRPPADHPWRRFSIKARRQKPDIPIERK
jgi:hypothetical protein